LLNKLGISKKIQANKQFTDQLMFVSRNVIYEKEDDFSTNDYDDVSTDLIKFCNSKVSNYDVKEINQSNFFSELHNFETKPWMIKFVYYESYTNFSNFRKAYVILSFDNF